MTQAELIGLLTTDFCENFAENIAQQVRDADGVEMLYALVAAAADHFPRNVRHKICFRGAYVLERIYFDAPELFTPFVERFCREDFPICADASARRHFTKIMVHLLQTYTPEPSSLERIAEVSAAWAVDPAAKVAVRIGAVEVLKCCRGKVDWVAKSWDDLIEVMRLDATPAVLCRLRGSWEKLAPRRI